MHKIKEMIGKNVPKDTIFISRINTKRTAKIIKLPNDTKDDFVTSRIMWLEGEEDGFNKGEGIDSYDRYIYIHGTQEEGLIGSKASHGCIRMRNIDICRLFDVVVCGTSIYIF